MMARSLAFSCYTYSYSECLFLLLSFMRWRHRRAFLLFFKSLYPAAGSMRRMFSRSCFYMTARSMVKSPILTMSPPGMRCSFYYLASRDALFFKSIIGVS